MSYLYRQGGHTRYEPIEDDDYLKSTGWKATGEWSPDYSVSSNNHNPPELSREERKAGQVWVATGFRDEEIDVGDGGRRTVKLPIYTKVNFGSAAQKQEQQSEKPPVAAQPETILQPTDGLAQARNEWDADRVGRSAQDIGSIHFNPTGNGVLDAATYGNKATDDYVRRFIPSLNRQSNLEAREIGETGSFHLGRFTGKVPELGDPKDLFNYYKDKLS